MLYGLYMYAYVLLLEANGDVQVFLDESLGINAFKQTYEDYKGEDELDVDTSYYNWSSTVWKMSAYCYGDWIADLRKIKVGE